nr:DUF2092 domain-containing protein [Polymorphobacter sp.]
MAAPTVQSATAGVVTAEASMALERMGAYLRTLKSFEVAATASTEEVYANGQKLQFLQRTTYTIGGPDKMAIEVRTDQQNRRFYYNGKTLSIVAPNSRMYTQFAVTGTNGELLTKAYDKYGIDFPLQDLFRWGSPTAVAVKPTEGFKVGTAQLGEHATEHFAFRQPGVDWQVWIDTGDKPLPRKMVITNTEDAAQPEYVAYFNWDMAPKIASDAFEFTPGKDDKLIDLSKAVASAK